MVAAGIILEDERFELIGGSMDPVHYQSEVKLLDEKLAQSDRPHLTNFLELWRKSRAA